MRKLIDEIIRHVAVSQREMAKLLETEHHAATLIAEAFRALPGGSPGLGDMSQWLKQAAAVGKPDSDFGLQPPRPPRPAGGRTVSLPGLWLNRGILAPEHRRAAQRSGQRRLPEKGSRGD